MDMDHYHEAARTMRQPSSILDTVSSVGLATFMIFWLTAINSLFAPPTLVSVATLFVFMLSLGLTIALPALLSALLPSTPAGMMLQRSRWRTWGFGATLAASLFLLWFAWSVLDAWLYQYPNVSETGVHTSLTIAALIIGVVIPTLSWVQMAPDKWLAEVMQAHRVKQLELLFEGQLNAIKAKFARHAILMQKGFANLTAAEAQELVADQEAITRAINRALMDVAQSIDVMTGQSTGVNLLPDEQITLLYDNLAASLERAQIRMRQPAALPVPSPVETVDLSPVATRSDAAQRDAHEPVSHDDDSRASLAQGGAAWRRVAFGDRSDKSIRAGVRTAYPHSFTAPKLSAMLNISDSRARELIADWVATGQLDKTNLRGHYAWKEV